jgi:peptide subunit release factor 1 (eRF1)
MYKDHDLNGVIFTDGNVCTWFEHKNHSIKKIGSSTIHLQNQFKNGGQSTNRLARLRDIQREQYISSLSEKSVALFYDKENSKQKVKNIIFCGPAEFKTEMSEHKIIRRFFENIHIVTMGSDLNIQLLNETIDNIEDPREKANVAEIKRLISQADSRLVFGEDIQYMIESCQIKTLYIHKDSEYLSSNNIEIGYEIEIIKISSPIINEYDGIIGVKFY